MAARRDTGFFYFFGSIVLLVAAVLFVTILNNTRSNTPTTDVRARAGLTNTLQFTAIVTSANETKGVITVDNLKFSETSRSGKAVDYGSWEVTVPTQFNLAQAFPGAKVTIRVDAKTFDVASHKLLATDVTLTPTK